MRKPRLRWAYPILFCSLGLLLPELAHAKDIKLFNCTGRRLRAEAHDTGSSTVIPASNKQIKKGDGRWLDCATVTPAGNGEMTAQCIIKIFKLKEYRDELVGKRAIFQTKASYRGKLTAGTYVVKTAKAGQEGEMTVTKGSGCN